MGKRKSKSARSQTPRSAPNQTELVIGLVVTAGTDLKNFKERLKAHFEEFRYKTEFHKLSEFLSDPKLVHMHGVEIASQPTGAESHFSRINSLMDAGDKLRKTAERGDALALYTIATIFSRRDKDESIRPAIVHVLESLKHPDEAETLREAYGQGFFLLGLYRSEPARREYLQDVKHISTEEANKLLSRDESGNTEFGQRTRDTFELADAFINLDDEQASFKELNRIIDLLFGHPFFTPSIDEHAMFLAYAASFSSADLSRQVGAVIVSPENEILALGLNEVPKYRGGRYFENDETDQRDFKLGYDSNAKKRDEFIEKILAIVRDGKAIPDEMDRGLRDLIKNNFSPTEFGRPVHAEMAALLACARLGLSPRCGTLYTTTFPCHNCAKHIVEAGIKKVIYVEPYPKSLALELHKDSIRFGAVGGESDTKKVSFEPFVGIAARHYVDLFSLRLSSGNAILRKSDSFQKISWDRIGAAPRLRMTNTTYIEREKYFSNQFREIRAHGNHAKAK